MKSDATDYSLNISQKVRKRIMISGERIKTFCHSLNNSLATVYIALGVNETHLKYLSGCAQGCEHLHLQELEPTWSGAGANLSGFQGMAS